LTVRISVVRRHGSTTLQHRHAHRIPHSTSVTTAKRPSCEAGRREANHRFGKGEIYIFFAGGLDRGDLFEPADEMNFWAQAVWRRLAQRWRVAALESRLRNMIPRSRFARRSEARYLPWWHRRVVTPSYLVRHGHDLKRPSKGFCQTSLRSSSRGASLCPKGKGLCLEGWQLARLSLVAILRHASLARCSSG
jgi:hypothetical protein